MLSCDLKVVGVSNHLMIGVYTTLSRKFTSGTVNLIKKRQCWPELMGLKEKVTVVSLSGHVVKLPVNSYICTHSAGLSLAEKS